MGRAYGVFVLAVHFVAGCADPCTDDGLFQTKCAADDSADADASGTGSEGAEEGSASGTADGDASESGSADGGGTTTGDGDGDADADADSGVGTETDGIGDCEDGMQNGDETDEDCGGSCGPTCEDGDDCLEDSDCINDLCNDNVCGDPVCDPEGNNGCQGCLQQQCCDKMVECLMDPTCKCWFECITHNNDFAPCKELCMTGGEGAVTSCANSKCADAGECGG